MPSRSHRFPAWVVAAPLLAFVLIALGSCFEPRRAHAQIASPPANCNLSARRFDSPLSYGKFAGWDQPRWAWHAMDLTESIAADRAARVVHIPRRIAPWILPATVVALHVIGVETHRYPLNLRDLAFDVSIRTLPAVRSLLGLPVAIGTTSAAYLALYCFASP